MNRSPVSRRAFLGLLGLSALELSGCVEPAPSPEPAPAAAAPTPTAPTSSAVPTATAAPPSPTVLRPSPLPTQAFPADFPTSGYLFARPSGQPTASAVTPGLQPLGVDVRRDGHIYVPQGYEPGVPLPMALLFHGYTGSARQGIELLRPHADERGILLVAVQSRKVTWDVVMEGDYGPDAAFVEAALESVFQRFAVDPQRLAIGGFSDGASYALSLGVINGDLFSHVMGFSPGSVEHGTRHGRPPIFIAHGTEDTVLSIDSCSRRIVPALEQDGYTVNYVEFNGPHSVPPTIAAAAVEWWLG